MREDLNGILHALWTGCQWNALPRDLPPKSMMHDYLEFWIWDGAGYGAGKKVKGRKRHILLDTLGFLLSVIVHFADIQDRDGTFHLLRQARRLFPFIERFIADSATEAISRQLGLDRTRGSCL